MEKVRLPRRNFNLESNQDPHFNLKTAIFGSFLIHLSLLLLKMPSPAILPKPKLSSIKMVMIERPMSKKLDIEIPKHEKEMLLPPKENAPIQGHGGHQSTSTMSKSLASANSISPTREIGYSFKGRGLKALTGLSQKIMINAGNGIENEGTISSLDKNKITGPDLSGNYKQNYQGDNQGHLLGEDESGSYDRSTTAKGVGVKKSIDTIFVSSKTVVLGSIEPEILRKILNEYLTQFKFCYQQELQEHSESIKGTLNLNFRIEADGSVSHIALKSENTHFSEKGIHCMGQILKSIDFPKPKGGGLVDVRQPLNFLSENTKI